jgi:membrane carboxypeptidase/penicillin-binding protein
LAAVVAGLSVTALIAIAAALIYPALPNLDALTDYQPKLPLRVYSEEGALIAEFGEERRAYVKIENVPKNMKDAVLAIEDRRFYQHGGIDAKGVLRAIKNNVTNPFINPKRAIKRQHEVLRDMQRFGFISEKVYKNALKQPLRFKASKQSRDVSAEYVAEIVREQLYAQYQDDIYSSGIKVYTTIHKASQEAANAAVREGVMDYDLRHGYRGPEKTLDLAALLAEDAARQRPGQTSAKTGRGGAHR